jgi:transposase
VPPREIRRLRDLTRYRTETVHDRTRDVNRLGTFLEDCGIKLSAVVSDITGASARAMLNALVAGERDPEVLAELAKAKMRNKRELLSRALAGNFTDHHAFMVASMLRAIDETDARITALSAETDRQMRPFRRQLEVLITIPGVSTMVAQVVIAEVGVDMSRFPSAAHLASWAGMCPANRESAGRRFSGHTRHGDRWLKAALYLAAATAGRSKTTYLGAQYRHLVPHRGTKRATVAVGHTILVAVWHMLTHDVPYQDLSPDHFTTRLGKARQTRRLIGQLAALGYDVHLAPREGAA